jgi:hypothetical protein
LTFNVRTWERKQVASPVSKHVDGLLHVWYEGWHLTFPEYGEPVVLARNSQPPDDAENASVQAAFAGNSNDAGFIRIDDWVVELPSKQDADSLPRVIPATPQRAQDLRDVGSWRPK